MKASKRKSGKGKSISLKGIARTAYFPSQELIEKLKGQLKQEALSEFCDKNKIKILGGLIKKMLGENYRGVIDLI